MDDRLYLLWIVADARHLFGLSVRGLYHHSAAVQSVAGWRAAATGACVHVGCEQWVSMAGRAGWRGVHGYGRRRATTTEVNLCGLMCAALRRERGMAAGVAAAQETEGRSAVLHTAGGRMGRAKYRLRCTGIGNFVGGERW